MAESSTSVICKLLERLIKDHMVDFPWRSCLTNMLCFWKWIEEGSPVDIIYLDFQKAFDKVPHQRVLLKLKAHGIGDGIIDWIEQWLTDRVQRVVVDGEVSNWKSVYGCIHNFHHSEKHTLHPGEDVCDKWWCHSAEPG